MHVTCPHCDNLLDVGDSPSEEVVCDSCGGAFQAAGDATGTTVAELRSLGKFQLLNQVGSGAFGAVWRAHDLELERIVALKILHASHLSAPTSRERFYREARAAAQLRHPGIVAVFEVKEMEGLPTIVSEFVQGLTLREFLAIHRLSFREAAELVALVADALDYAHGMGLVHRDIKPANIMIETPRGEPIGSASDDSDTVIHQSTPASSTAGSSGSRSRASSTQAASLRFRPLLLDFGLALREEAEATMTSEGQIIGTPAYMSPEQAGGHGHRVDRRCDVYSLGVVLYELLTGEMPFRGTKVAIVQQVLNDEPRPPRRLNHKIPRDLETICQKAMAKWPQRRYGTAAEFAADLRCFLHGESISARPAGRFERTWRWARRNPLAAGLAVAVAALLVTVAVGASTAAFYLGNAAIQEASLRAAAEDATKIAQVKAAESHDRLVRHYVATGLQHLEESDMFASLLWFADALREDQADAARAEVHRVRLATALQNCPKLTQIWLHDGAVFWVEFSSDSSRLVSASNDQTAQVWDTATGERACAPLRHEGPVFHAAFSPDGSRIVTASGDSTARVWNAATGEPVGPPLRHAARVQRAEFSRDGNRIVTASFDKTARVWDAATGEPVTPPIPHRNEVHFASFSPDGTRVSTASDDGTARVWNAATGEPVTPPLQHMSQVHSAEFSPDGRFVLTASNDYSAKVWDATTGQAVTRPLEHFAQVLHAAFSPDGRRIVTASQDHSARVWDAATGELVAPVLKHRAVVNFASFSPDGRHVLTAGNDDTARLWDARTGELVTAPLRQTSGVFQATLSSDGRRIATASYNSTARIWDVATSGSSMPILRHAGQVSYVSFSPSGRRVVTASLDHTARVWDADTGDPVTPPLVHKKAVNSATFSRDGRRVVTASGGPYGSEGEAEARIWDAVTGESITPPLRHGASVKCATFSPDGRHIVTASADRTARVWDAATGEPASPPMRHDHWVYHADFSPDGRFVATASFDLTARVWDAATGEPVTPPMKHDAGCPLYHVSFSPDGRRVVTASSSAIGTKGTARVWDAATGEPITPALDHNSAYVFHAVFSSDGRHILTASGDQRARIIDADTGERSVPFMRHNGVVFQAIFNATGKLVATASWDKTARVWDAATGMPVSPPLPHQNELQCVAFSPDSRRLATASSDSTARIWNIAPDTRPIEDLSTLAKLLGGTLVDAAAGASSGGSDSPDEAWQVLRREYPTDFVATVNDVVAWYRRQADECEATGNWSAAIFHLDRLIAAEPGDASLRDRRAKAVEKLGQ